ncbi:DUF1996 domain-containing protein [Umezawaea endophytica]|uniref:DUF1996 domain-containing protein n=1 Tax=Umezawaea endophytica TaxID=1654476 RepID=A0A9X2VWD5_9PSEU|nr:DUF1996 domain-containing protein [Umezawaea endophytica]MCS7483264.1 DUF1996 domain-containing protein [Umezawaea endophytica]
MTRSQGRHTFSRRAKLTAGMTGLALTVGLAVAFTTTGDQGQARADGADKSLFVDITTVKANVKTPKPQQDATTGTFTVDCGLNENKHFNGDNFIAAPGVQNGAEHLHDYVGNLTTDADSTDESLQAGGTTCKNGDKSAYFWPVIRIDKGEEEAAAEEGAAASGEAPAEEQAGQNQQQGNRNQQQGGNQQGNQQQGNQRGGQNQQQGDNDNQRGGNQNDRPQGFQRDNDNDQNGNQRNGQQNNRQGQGNKDNAADENANQNAGQNADQNAGAQDGQAAEDAAQNEANLGKDAAEELPGNDGVIQEPKAADLTFRGSPVGDVVAMPKFLKILYGDAKRSINGDKNTKASWTCAGFEDKVLLDKYPICPNGANVKRIHDFPGCWDGKNTDSANHRDHVAFADANGQCQNGFQAIPQLRITLTYDIPADVQQNGQYAVDSFPAEEHDPLTDHDDFANVMSDQIMKRLVNCINTNKTCKE